MAWAQRSHPQHPSASHSSPPLLPPDIASPSEPTTNMGVATASTAQVSAGGFTFPNQSSSSFPLPSLSPTLVDLPNHGHRPSIKLKFSGGGSNILNSTVVDAAGRSLYVISSTSKRTTLLSCGNNTEVATVEWDHASPRMVFRGRKMKCKEWLPRTGQDTESRVLTHGDTQFMWMKRSNSGYLIPADRPGLSVAKWRIQSQTSDLRLELFQEALVEWGLLEAIVLSLVLMRSGYCLGDTFHAIRDCYMSVPVAGLG